MSSQLIEKLLELINDTDLEVIKKPDGSIKVIGGECVVNWWPESKRHTAYVEGSSRGVKNATPKMVIAMANGEHP